MIKSFSCTHITSEDFLKKVKDALADRNLGKMIDIHSSDKEIKVKISKLGTSELVYDLKNTKGGFTCTAKSEKIAFVHKPLRKEIETKFSDMLKKFGATVEKDEA